MVRKSETVTELKDLAAASGVAAAAQEAAAPRQPKKDAQGRSYATGRRKDAVARVWIKPGSGKVTVNGRTQEVYFGRQTHLLVLNQPFLIVNRVNQYDVVCTVAGGGLSGQAGAIRHGISRALQMFEPDLRSTLKTAGMLTRDARSVERKKVGLHKARRAKQWAKR
jgi:small subunit ribosomal protein S9